MSNVRSMTSEEMLNQLPAVLYEDKNTYALAAAIALMLESRHAQIEALNIYGNIENLPESLLDILAEDFGIPWYDVNYTQEQKAAIVKSAWKLFRKLGTKSAVLEGLAVVVEGEIDILEWFEYDGDPYYFRIYVTGDDGTDDYSTALKVIRYYKPVRSWLEGITVEHSELAADAIPVNTTPVCTWLSTCLPCWDETVIGNFILDEDVLDADSV